ncbi:MAG: ABC transporter substrate-binding protein, partial [Rhodobacterales bacterium]
MKKIMTGALALMVATAAHAADEVKLQLQWVTQAQFAGYYVALDKGYYSAEDLDVTILSGGPDIAPPQVLAGGGADVMLNWMPSALAAREKGLPVVNIAQPFKTSGLMLTCWKDTGIKSPADFKGKTIGVWFYGNEYPFLSWMSQEGISTDGGADGVTVLRQGFNVDPLLQRQADCISTMTYNEYGQVLDAGVSEDELVTFKYENQGVATLEDGIYALEENLSDPAFVDKMVRFVRASMKGWKYAEANPTEAAGIVLDNDESGAQTKAHQVRMMAEIAKLTAGSNGSLDPADFDRTVATL